MSEQRLAYAAIASVVALVIVCLALIVMVRPAQARDVEPDWTWKVYPTDKTNTEALWGMRMRESDKDASDALREVILDAMTEYRAKSNYPSITYPYATWVDTTKLPTNWDGTPKVTCTGIDPAFNTNTVSTVDGMAMAVGYQDGVVKVVDR